MHPAASVFIGALAVLASACAAPPPVTDSLASPTAKHLSSDGAVIAAIAKEHYKYGAENAPPQVKPGGDEGWTPRYDFGGQGFTFTDYVQPMHGAVPRQSLKWVSFQKPAYDGTGTPYAH